MRGAIKPGSGLTPQEQSVMDRWDAGQGYGLISTALGLPTGAVARIVRMYDASDAPDRAYVTRCRVSNAAYCAAIVASGGRFA